MVLGDRLFDMAKTGHEITGFQPYILTAGKAITAQWVKKARASALAGAYISLEQQFPQ